LIPTPNAPTCSDLKRWHEFASCICAIELLEIVGGCSLVTPLDGYTTSQPTDQDASWFPDSQQEVDTALETQDVEQEWEPEQEPDAGGDLDAVQDLDATQQDTAPPCPILTGGDVCSALPSLQSPQTVDGVGDEFCSVAATRLEWSGAAKLVGTHPADEPSYAVLVRAAWSSVGLHFHFRVEQASPVVVPADDGEDLWHGDAIELFVKGDNLLTGPFREVSNDVGAVQIITTPPSDPQKARSTISPASGAIVDSYDAQLYAARAVSGGYELEVSVPWHKINPSTPRTAGSRVALDFIADYHVRSADGPPPRHGQFYIIYKLNDPGDVSSCGVALEPACDDRTWCTPVLLQ
jgi:hypothetical protein